MKNLFLFSVCLLTLSIMFAFLPVQTVKVTVEGNIRKFVEYGQGEKCQVVEVGALDMDCFALSKRPSDSQISQMLRRRDSFNQSNTDSSGFYSVPLVDNKSKPDFTVSQEYYQHIIKSTFSSPKPISFYVLAIDRDKKFYQIFPVSSTPNKGIIKSKKLYLGLDYTEYSDDVVKARQ